MSDAAEKSQCPYCGGNMHYYWHSLNKGLCMALFELYKRGKANIARMGLTHNQICNFQKLKYWGLVEQLGSGIWAMTTKGHQFVSGRIRIHKRVKTYRQRTVDYSGDMVLCHDVVNTEWPKIAQYVLERESAIFQ